MSDLSNRQTVDDLRRIINEGLGKMGIHTAYDFSPLLMDLVAYIVDRDHKVINQTLAGQLERNKDAR
jgi:hypothetical protein